MCDVSLVKVRDSNVSYPIKTLRTPNVCSVLYFDDEWGQEERPRREILPGFLLYIKQQLFPEGVTPIGIFNTKQIWFVIRWNINDARSKGNRLTRPMSLYGRCDVTYGSILIQSTFPYGFVFINYKQSATKSIQKHEKLDPASNLMPSRSRDTSFSLEFPAPWDFNKLDGRTWSFVFLWTLQKWR